jgi:CRP/FNR family transcriptional regulator, nitrogen fixation regulation protein
MTLAYAFTAPAVPHHLALAEGDEMDRIGVRIAYAKNEEIYGQDEDAEMIYRVVSGAVRTSRLTSDGRRQIAAFYGPGELFGLDMNGSHRFAAEALSDCVVTVVRRSVARAKGHEGLERMIWDAAMAELSRTQEHLVLLGRKNACERVAALLLSIAEDQAGAVAELPMGRQDMADYLGLTIETVSRMMTQLQTEGVIELFGCRKFRIRRSEALELMAA